MLFVELKEMWLMDDDIECDDEVALTCPHSQGREM